MNIETERPVTIFRNDNDYGTFYKIGLSKKDKEGNYISGYKDCRFKKGVVLENKTKIYIKKAWLDFYVKDKRTIDYIFIYDFETIDETMANAKKDYEILKEVLEDKTDPFKEFGEQIEINDADLPF